MSGKRRWFSPRPRETVGVFFRAQKRIPCKSQTKPTGGKRAGRRTAAGADAKKNAKGDVQTTDRIKKKLPIAHKWANRSDTARTSSVRSPSDRNAAGRTRSRPVPAGRARWPLKGSASPSSSDGGRFVGEDGGPFTRPGEKRRRALRTFLFFRCNACRSARRQLVKHLTYVRRRTDDTHEQRTGAAEGFS